MANIDTTRPAAGLSASAFFNIATPVFGAIIDWNNQRVTRNALSKLSDRELEDIGLARGDIDQIARRVIR
ncbi:DUF1127 domain-containing protein [Yoonia sp. 2307UL14-13]|uniref:DUF1127 domain-containing protein n=1 Tax=Yoonia sp. 2307UL14-13 TaxID=3126506 RepID=UPI0030959F49